MHVGKSGKFQEYFIKIPGVSRRQVFFPGVSRAWKTWKSNSRTFQELYKPCNNNSNNK
jgi:hypothetical protein